MEKGVGIGVLAVGVLVLEIDVSTGMLLVLGMLEFRCMCRNQECLHT